MVDELVSSVRRIAADLRPAMLDDLGLAAAIDWLAADCAAQSGLHVVAHCDTQDEGMADEARTAAYRVVQEALTNIRRHASARRVDIDVHSSEQELMVRVTDDGVGMAPQSANKRGSYGLVGMRERARQLGGGLHVGAGPTGGTRIEWRIPLVTDAPDHDTTTIPALL